MSAQPGIEIKLCQSSTAMALGKVYKFLHLDKLVEAVMHKTRLEVTVDADRHEGDPLEDLFIPCEPGEHRVKVALLGWSPTNKVARVMNETSAKVKVEPGTVTLIEYRFADGAMLPGKKNTSLEVVGARHA